MSGPSAPEPAPLPSEEGDRALRLAHELQDRIARERESAARLRAYLEQAHPGTTASAGG